MAHIETVLLEGQRRGLIGKGPIEEHLHHSLGFAEGLSESTRFVDLGSGGGVPALVVAIEDPSKFCTLIESAERRCRFLEWAVSELEIADRVEVLHGGVEDCARDSLLRGNFDGVSSRSFGPPSVTAECARGFLSPEGILVVSDPPVVKRWSDEDLTQLNFKVERSYVYTAQPTGADAIGLDDAGENSSSSSFTVIRAVGACPETVPRRRGIPRKRPLF